MYFQRPKAVIFDMDGTTVRHVNPRILGLLEFLDDLVFRSGKLFRRQASLTSLPPPMEKPPRLLVHRMIHTLRRKSVEQIVQPCPGVLDVLELFKTQNIPMAIASNGLGKGYGDDILKKFDLEQFFQIAIFREDFKRAKPHPDGLLKALESLNVTYAEHDTIWYIGDRHKDVSAALAASELVTPRILPFSYGLNAAFAIFEKGQSPDQVILNYFDFLEKMKELIESDPAQDHAPAARKDAQHS